MKMAGLVVEGGAMRGLYTDGVLDALLDYKIMFPYVIGVSAGISNAYSYVSKQRGRNWEIIEKYRNDKRYFSIRNYFKEKSIFGMDFIYDEIPNQLIPYDYQALKAYQGKLLAGVTNVKTGKVEYFDQYSADRQFTILRATCALPLFFPVIQLNGNGYYDGGMADPIPIRKSIADGNPKNLIVLTREVGYQKTAGKSTRLSAKLIRKKFPALEPIVLNRHIAYNETVAYCEQLEQEGKAILLRPAAEVNVGRFEKDIPTLKRLYEAGYQDTVAKIDQIRGFLQEETLSAKN